jgi:dimethylargininase
MTSTFTRAILRRPGKSYVNGITTSHEGAPVLDLALAQHAAYAEALKSLGLSITVLEADEAYPDGTFVEDAAIVTPTEGVVTRPGAPSRAGETAAIETALGAHFSHLHHITAPGTVDGGDICETDDGFLIGVSARTNAEGARQLADILAGFGIRGVIVDIRPIEGLLHLKTGISYLGEGRMAVAEDLAQLPFLKAYEPVVVPKDEAYAANCIAVNGKVIVAAGYPKFTETLVRLGLEPLALEMSEFRKMDGGLSCLSLRF